MKCRITRRALASFVAGGALVATSVVLAPGVAGATSSAPSQGQINATQNQVSALENQIAQDQRQSEALSQQYDAAEQTVQTVQAALTSTSATIKKVQARIAVDRARLAKDAIDAYVYGTTATQVPGMFATSANQSDVRAEYDSTVAGDLGVDRAVLENQQAQLSAVEARQRSQENQASQAAAQAKSLAAANATATANDQGTLQQVQGQLAQEVAAAALAKAQQEAAAAAAARSAQQAAAAAAAAQNAANVAAQVGGTSTGAAATAAANQAAQAAATVTSASASTATTTPPSTPAASQQPPSPPPSNGGAGAAAVAAAESQLGVPYVYGGESPGSGFDCSGLTQWAWGQAGVSIPRTAAAQYAAVAPVSTSALQPGDLLFYYNLDGDSMVDHVAMYVGGGEVIQAPYTGATVSYSPIYYGGLIGAGRP